MSLPHCPPEPAVVRLPTHCGGAAAPELHRALLAATGGGDAPTVDASEVETVGQAVLQLLLSARTSFPELVIAAPSPAFAERVRALALAPALGLAPAEA